VSDSCFSFVLLLKDTLKSLILYTYIRCSSNLDEDDKENMQVEEQGTAVFMDGNSRVDLKVVVNRTNSQGIAKANFFILKFR